MNTLMLGLILATEISLALSRKARWAVGDVYVCMYMFRVFFLHSTVYGCKQALFLKVDLLFQIHYFFQFLMLNVRLICICVFGLGLLRLDKFDLHNRNL